MMSETCDRHNLMVFKAIQLFRLSGVGMNTLVGLCPMFSSYGEERPIKALTISERVNLKELECQTRANTSPFNGKSLRPWR
jgi:hypothetical protein